MITEHRLRLSRIDDEQTIRLPKELEFEEREVIVRKIGNRLVIVPVPEQSLLELLDSWEPIDEEFPEIDDPPPDPVEI